MEEDGVRRTRHRGLEALLLLPEEKDRSIKEQARSLVEPVTDLEGLILQFSRLTQGEAMDKETWDQSMETMRRPGPPSSNALKCSR